MKKNVTIIITLIILIVIVSFYIFVNNKNNIDENRYEKPIISFTYLENSGITIESGIYKYGDVDENGRIDDDDIVNINHIINNEYTFTNEQIKLADFNKDKIVDNNDIISIKEYLKNIKKEEYDVYKKKLSYCLSKENDYSKCKWQKDNHLKLENEEEYYIFSKYRNNEVSVGYKIKNSTVMQQNDIIREDTD